MQKVILVIIKKTILIIGRNQISDEASDASSCGGCDRRKANEPPTEEGQRYGLCRKGGGVG